MWVGSQLVRTAQTARTSQLPNKVRSREESAETKTVMNTFSVHSSDDKICFNRHSAALILADLHNELVNKDINCSALLLIGMLRPAIVWRLLTSHTTAPQAQLS